MDDLELATAELPEAIREWLTLQPAVVVYLEQIGNDRVLMRRVPDLDPALLARVRVTIAKYREALMNLT